mgnify:CR=1 FL=1
MRAALCIALAAVGIVTFAARSTAVTAPPARRISRTSSLAL